MKKFLFGLAILCSIFFMVNVSAEENTIFIESLTIEDKSDNVILNEETTIDGNTIKSNLSFKDKNDYIIYKLILKNNSDKTYSIENILDDNQNKAFLYTYQFDDKEFKSNEEKVVYLTIKYDEISADSELDENNTYHLESTNKITIQLKEVSYNSIINVNPPTIRNSIGLIVFILIGILIFNSSFVSKKKKKLLFFIIGILSLMNISKASAEADFIKVELILTNKFDVPINFLENNWNSRISENYTKISVTKDKAIPDEAADVSEKQDGSIKAWIDGDTVYIASNYKIYTPRNSTSLFSKKSNVMDIKFGEDSISSRFSTDLSYMFSGLSLLEELDTSWFDTLNVTNMRSMFYNCASLKELNLGSFDTSKVIDIEFIFEGMDSLKEIIVPKVLPASDISFNLPVEFKDSFETKYMNFNNTITPKTKLILNSESCYLVSGKSFNNKIKNLAGDSSPTYNSANTTITTIKRTNTRPNVDQMTDDNIISTNKEVPVYAWFDNGTIYYYSDIESPLLNPNCSYMFSNLRNLQTIELNTLDFINVTNMSYMFYYAGYNLTTWSVDLSNWNTSNVSDMSYIFNYAGYKSQVWDIGNISNWNTSKVTNMSSMFDYAGYSVTTWSIDLSNWNTSNVRNMNSMFYYAGYNATEWNVGDLSNWNTSKVTNMSNMFNCAGYNAAIFDIGNLSDWNTLNVASTNRMFYQAGRNATEWIIGDLSNWDTSNITNMSSMFCYAGFKVATFDIGNLSNWNTSKVTNMSNMFNCAGYNATTWNSIGTLKVYASNIQNMFSSCSNGKANLKIYSDPSSYNNAFNNAATKNGSAITVDYTSSVTNIDNIIATKSSNSNVLKGNLITD